MYIDVIPNKISGKRTVLTVTEGHFLCCMLLVQNRVANHDCQKISDLRHELVIRLEIAMDIAIMDRYE